MKCIFEVSARTTLTESAELKHEKLISFLKTVPYPWGLPSDVDPPFPGFGKEATSIFKLNKYLGHGIKMTIFYPYRNGLDDDSFYDDRIYIEFNSKKIDYSVLINEIFPRFLKGFGACAGCIFDELLIFKDFEEKRFGNGRKVINRVYPISFYDKIICERFFKRSPKKIVDLLKGHIYKAELLNEGVMIIADDKPFSIDESIDFEKRLKSILKF